MVTYKLITAYTWTRHLFLPLWTCRPRESSIACVFVVILPIKYSLAPYRLLDTVTEYSAIQFLLPQGSYSDESLEIIDSTNSKASH